MLHAGRNFTEYGMNAVKVRLRVKANVELASAGVRTAMRHCQASAIVFVFVMLAINGISGSAGTVAIRASALRDESRNDAMERNSVIEPFVREFFEVCDGVRSVLVEQFQSDFFAVRHFDYSLFRQLSLLLKSFRLIVQQDADGKKAAAVAVSFPLMARIEYFERYGRS